MGDNQINKERENIVKWEAMQVKIEDKRLAMQAEDFELAQLSKLNLIVIEMKHTLPQHYPDFLPAISNGSPEQQSVTTLTTSIVQLSSSHLFLGGSACHSIERAQLPLARATGQI